MSSDACSRIGKWETDGHTDATPHRRDSRRQRPLLLKVLRHDDDTRQKEQPVPNTHDNALRDQQLSIARADTRHHHAQDGEEGAATDQSAKVPRVVERARDHADEEKQKTLHGAYPCYLGVGVRMEAG